MNYFTIEVEIFEKTDHVASKLLIEFLLVLLFIH